MYYLLSAYNSDGDNPPSCISLDLILQLCKVHQHDSSVKEEMRLQDI